MCSVININDLDKSANANIISKLDSEITKEDGLENPSFVADKDDKQTDGKSMDNHEVQEVDDSNPDQYRMHYRVADSPPVHLTVLFGLQQIFLSLSSTMSISLIVTSQICADDLDLVKSEIMSTFLFMCGVCTLLQCTVGVRLPIIQGASGKFIPAVTALMSLRPLCTDIITKAISTDSNSTDILTTDDNRTEIWQIRMREIQGGIILASIVQIVVGCTGILGGVLHFIGPITIVPTIALVGLSLIDVAMRFCQVHWGITALTVCLVFLFSLYVSDIRIPFPAFSRRRKCHVTRYPIFKLLPIILAVAISWAVCGILTATDKLSSDPNHSEYKARTDARVGALDTARWFYFPYPGQWGLPTFSVAGFMAMFAATIASIIESVGDYYACAKISGELPPPTHAVNRGIAIEGFGSVIAGVVGSGGATTSYSQNVGAIGFTKVASRRVFQSAGLIFLVCGLCGKFGAVLTMIPDPVLGGAMLVSFGMVTAVGLSSLQFVSLRSSRNLVIIGCSLLIGLMAPRYITTNPGCIQTGNDEADRVITVLLSTAMFVGGFIGFVLDNTVPGTAEERGIRSWRRNYDVSNTRSTDDDTTYDLPYIMGCLRRHKWTTYIPFLPTFDVNFANMFRRCCLKSSNERTTYEINS